MVLRSETGYLRYCMMPLASHSSGSLKSLSMERLMEKKSRFLTENFVIETNDPGSVSQLLLGVSETFYQKLRSQQKSHSAFLSSANESVDLQQTTKRSWSSRSKLNFCHPTSSFVLKNIQKI